jgi:general L-amino acid transport system ATP-binding protein
MVFQQFNLFPHLSVKENITLAPIWVKKMPKAEAEELAMRQLEIVKIPEQANKYPGQLSIFFKFPVNSIPSTTIEPS